MLADVAGDVRRFVSRHDRNDALALTQSWRISLAQQALRRGRPLRIIAGELDYGGEAALSRAFKAHIGVAPREWQSQLRSAN